ncbi:MAG TPA: YciI family protein [Chloroflexota bacterium]|nr:YciI family protein [Chloroflexota bacterium]
MAGLTTQPLYYVIFLTTTYKSLAEAQEHAPEDIAAHLARSKRLHEQGVVVMAGAFLDRPDEPLSTMVVCTSREAADDYIQGDPFVRKGQVSAWHIREWANMFA